MPRTMVSMVVTIWILAQTVERVPSLPRWFRGSSLALLAQPPGFETETSSRSVGARCHPGRRMTVEPRTVGDTKQTPTERGRTRSRGLRVAPGRGLDAAQPTGRRGRRCALATACSPRTRARCSRAVRGKGAPVWGIAGDDRGRPRRTLSAIVLVPAGVIADHEVVARIHQAEWEAELEVFTHRRAADRAALGVPGLGGRDDHDRVAVPVRAVHRRGRTTRGSTWPAGTPAR